MKWPDFRFPPINLWVLSMVTTTKTKTFKKSCATCAHHPKDARSIDDAPPICWNCIAGSNGANWDHPFWKEKKDGS